MSLSPFPSSSRLVRPYRHQLADCQIRLAQKLEPKNVQADIQPSCKTVDYFGSYLEPNQAGTQGWEIWKLPPLEKQKFWRTTDIGSVITFDLDMSIGKM